MIEFLIFLWSFVIGFLTIPISTIRTLPILMKELLRIQSESTNYHRISDFLCRVILEVKLSSQPEVLFDHIHRTELNEKLQVAKSSRKSRNSYLE